MEIQEALENCNSYEGDNIWEDIIYEKYWDDLNIEACQTHDGNAIIFKDGSKIAYFESSKSWKLVKN